MLVSAQIAENVGLDISFYQPKQHLFLFYTVKTRIEEKCARTLEFPFSSVYCMLSSHKIYGMLQDYVK